MMEVVFYSPPCSFVEKFFNRYTLSFKVVAPEDPVLWCMNQETKNYFRSLMVKKLFAFQKVGVQVGTMDAIPLL